MVYLLFQIVFAILWFKLTIFFTKKLKRSSHTVFIWVLSSLLLLNHVTLIVLGAVEIYAPTTLFYNVFCTLLFVFEPLLIFVTATSLLYLFYYQAVRRLKSE